MSGYIDKSLDELLVIKHKVGSSHPAYEHACEALASYYRHLNVWEVDGSGRDCTIIHVITYMVSPCQSNENIPNCHIAVHYLFI